MDSELIMCSSASCSVLVSITPWRVRDERSWEIQNPLLLRSHRGSGAHARGLRETLAGPGAVDRRGVSGRARAGVRGTVPRDGSFDYVA
jgi:hypothetical protein